MSFVSPQATAPQAQAYGSHVLYSGTLAAQTSQMLDVYLNPNDWYITVMSITGDPCWCAIWGNTTGKYYGYNMLTGNGLVNAAGDGWDFCAVNPIIDNHIVISVICPTGAGGGPGKFMLIGSSQPPILPRKNIETWAAQVQGVTGAVIGGSLGQFFRILGVTITGSGGGNFSVNVAQHANIPARRTALIAAGNGTGQGNNIDIDFSGAGGIVCGGVAANTVTVGVANNATAYCEAAVRALVYGG